MSRRKVEVGVHFNGSKNNGKLEVRVNPWLISAKAGSTDYLEWESVGLNGQPDKVTRMQIVAYDPATWPFPGSTYSGTKPKTGSVKASAKPDTEHAYTITVYFVDQGGYERSASIDPDMVIE